MLNFRSLYSFLLTRGLRSSRNPEDPAWCGSATASPSVKWGSNSAWYTVSAQSMSVAAVIASAARGAISLHLADPFLRVSTLHLPLTPLPPLASSPPVSWTFMPQALCSRGFTLASSLLLSLLPVLGHWNTSLFYFLQGLIFAGIGKNLSYVFYLSVYYLSPLVWKF